MAAELLGPADLDRAAAALADGRLVAFATETVYGLGADAANPDAVAGIFAAKGRPTGHPLIVHMADRADLDRFGTDVSPDAKLLAGAFWPGPLTIIVGRADTVAPETTGGRDTVGLRVPDHPVALGLLHRFGGGVAAPSANRFGSVSPTTAQHVLDDLGDVIDVVVDGGSCRVGVESTIVEMTGPEPILLRPGGISTIELESVLGRPVADGRGGPSRAPGMQVSHYAPDASVALLDRPPTDADLRALDRVEPAERIGVIGPIEVAHVPSWVLPADAAGYAAGLYRTFREADRAGVTRLLVVPPTEGALRDAVLDRLQKAAAPR